jgi:hypothetical protein
MIPLLTFLAAMQSAASPMITKLPRTAWVFSTIGHSEFCAAGDVAIDLQTGKYTLTKRAPRRICDQADIERPVTNGRLTGQGLARIRAAFLSAIKDGLEQSPEPLPKGYYDLIIMNSGTPTLVVKTARATRSAPDDINRWSGAATQLHDTLDAEFATRAWH